MDAQYMCSKLETWSQTIEKNPWTDECHAKIDYLLLQTTCEKSLLENMLMVFPVDSLSDAYCDARENFMQIQVQFNDLAHVALFLRHSGPMRFREVDSSESQSKRPKVQRLD